MITSGCSSETFRSWSLLKAFHLLFDQYYNFILITFDQGEDQKKKKEKEKKWDW